MTSVVDFVKKHWPLAAALAAFVAVSQLSLVYGDELRAFFLDDPSGTGIALFVAILFIVSIVPGVSTLPFVPLAVAIWGWQGAAAMMVIVWTLAGQALFLLARSVGKKRLRWFFRHGQEKVIESIVARHSWLRAVLLRFAVDGELISYAFGLYSGMSGFAFFTATLVGSVPPALAYAYLGRMPLAVQAWVLVAAGAIFGLSVLIARTAWFANMREKAPHSVRE